MSISVYELFMLNESVGPALLKVLKYGAAGGAAGGVGYGGYKGVEAAKDKYDEVMNPGEHLTKKAGQVGKEVKEVTDKAKEMETQAANAKKALATGTTPETAKTTADAVKTTTGTTAANTGTTGEGFLSGTATNAGKAIKSGAESLGKLASDHPEIAGTAGILGAGALGYKLLKDRRNKQQQQFSY